jgi:hypothetical protein
LLLSRISNTLRSQATVSFRFGLAAALTIGSLFAQLSSPPPTTINLGSQGRNPNFSSYPVTLPVTVGTSLPATCILGQLFFNTAAAPGANLYGCIATNAWTLEGAAASAAVTLNPTSLTFASQTHGTTSAGQTITITNSGTAALIISGVTVSGTNKNDFAVANNCGSVVGAGASCTLTVTFTPAGTGSESAVISIADNAANSPQGLTVLGSGN